MLNEFLVQMDGVGKDQTGVLVLGATNVVGCVLTVLQIAMGVGCGYSSSFPETYLYPSSRRRGACDDVQDPLRQGGSHAH